jgi:hypothetical protein
MTLRLRSQLLKREQVHSSCFPPPSSSLGALRRLLLFCFSVLRPWGSQDLGCLCLWAGPLLFVRRESTSRICMGSYCLALEGGQREPWVMVSNWLLRSTFKRQQCSWQAAPAHACPEPCEVEDRALPMPRQEPFKGCMLIHTCVPSQGWCMVGTTRDVVRKHIQAQRWL